MATFSTNSPQHRGHVVCLPLPAQSHIGAMLKIAKLLHYRGFFVSFVNSDFNHRRLVEAQDGRDVHLPPAFQLLAISDGLPPSQANASQSPDDIAYAAMHGMVGPFCDLIDDLNGKAKATAEEGDDNGTFPAVSCILSDGFMTFPAKPASDKYQLPNIYLWTISACSLLGFMQGPDLIQRGLCPLKDESCRWNGYLDTVVDWIDGFPSMRLRDLPSFIRVTDLNDIMLNFIIQTTNRVNEATTTIIHTVESLETNVLDTPSSMISGPIYTVNILLNRIPHQYNPIGSNLWKEDVGCLKWLNSQTKDSVLYINFGSHTHLTKQQFVEFAMGIANSKQTFLWIIRPDLMKGDGADIIPTEFIEMTKGRCYLSSWCPQEDVLTHPSINGFLTHCGWNSIMESLSAGVPMLCWPFLGDQPTNCKYICDEWIVGLEIDPVVSRDNVELLVRELMVGEKGKELKRNAMRWKKLVNEAADSSVNNLHKLFSHKRKIQHKHDNVSK